MQQRENAHKENTKAQAHLGPSWVCWAGNSLFGCVQTLHSIDSQIRSFLLLLAAAVRRPSQSFTTASAQPLVIAVSLGRWLFLHLFMRPASHTTPPPQFPPAIGLHTLNAATIPPPLLLRIPAPARYQRLTRMVSEFCVFVRVRLNYLLRVPEINTNTHVHSQPIPTPFSRTRQTRRALNCCEEATRRAAAGDLEIEFL